MLFCCTPDMYGHWAAGGQALGLLLSPEGEYVRGIVMNELAKGIDASWRLALDSAVDSLRSQLLVVFGVRLFSFIFICRTSVLSRGTRNLAALDCLGADYFGANATGMEDSKLPRLMARQTTSG